MTLLELLAATRDRLDDYGGDTGTPDVGDTYYWQSHDKGCIWKNAELIAWLNEAEGEAARRACLLSSTFSITLVPGTASYALNPLLWMVDRARLNTAGVLLTRTTRTAMDDSRANWEAATGTPRLFFVIGANLTLYPTPIAVDTLKVTGWIDPAPMADWTDAPTIPEPYHRDLIEWVGFRAAQKRDADAHIGSPDQYLTNFSRRYGPDASVQQMRSWSECGSTGVIRVP